MKLGLFLRLGVLSSWCCIWFLIEYISANFWIGNNFILLTGEDGSAMEFNARGGMGCISPNPNITFDMELICKKQIL